MVGCATRTVHETDDLPPEPEQEEMIESEARLPLREAPVKTPGGRYVYLTFDDGPSHNTNRILDVLAELQIKGTFFFVGDRILEFEEEDAAKILRRVLDEGHTIGLHSMSHDAHHLYWSPGAYLNFYNEMREVQSLIYKLTGGHKTNLYRAPYGTRSLFTQNHIKKMINSGMKGWDWNVDTKDWKLTTTAQILERVQADMKANEYPDNVVVLFHERNVTVQSLPAVVEYFRNLGYSFLPYHPDNHFPMNFMYNPDL